MNESKVARMDELEDFFEDFKGVDANELQDMIPRTGGVARETPVGVGGVKSAAARSVPRWWRNSWRWNANTASRSL